MNNAKSLYWKPAPKTPAQKAFMAGSLDNAKTLKGFKTSNKISPQSLRIQKENRMRKMKMQLKKKGLQRNYSK